MVQEAQLGVFARLPVPGKVKTRLAAAVGPDQATSAYKAFAENCFREASRCQGADTTLFCSVPEEEQGCREWLDSLGLLVSDVGTAPQATSPDLGDRMATAIASMLGKGCKKAMIVGTDIPDISAEIISEAVKALDDFDMVLGPACDGGYYLLGVSKPLPEGTLKGIQWSTEEVYESTQRNAEASGLTVAPRTALPVLQDIDYIEDLASWYKGTTSSAGSREDHPVRKAVAPLVDAFLASTQTDPDASESGQ